jgi:hypothetical protein
MACASRRLSSVLLASVLLLAGIMAIPATPAVAESSYHKMKKKLHKVERKTGIFLQDTGDILEDNFSIEICLDDDVDEPSAENGSKAGKAAGKSSAKEHPKKQHEGKP